MEARKGGLRCHWDYLFLKTFPSSKKEFSRCGDRALPHDVPAQVQTMGRHEITGKMKSGFLAFLSSV